MIRVGILGWGTIGRNLDLAIGSDSSIRERLSVSAIASRFTAGNPDPRAVSVDELGGHCDVVVEAAGPDAVREHVGRYLDAGTDVLVLSLGALADRVLRDRLQTSGPGRLMYCSGAIGGIDMIEAARLHGRVRRVTINTTKPMAVLERDWMSTELLERMRFSDQPVECFRGSVAQAVNRFPESLNVAAALGLAAGCFDVVEVVVTGSPNATSNTHDISVEADSGRTRVTVENVASPDNPRTSHVTAWAALRSLRALAGAEGVFA